MNMKFCLNLCVPKLMLNVKMPIVLMLLPLTEQSLMPAQGYILSVQYIFCRHFSLKSDFEAHMSQSVEIFLF